MAGYVISSLATITKLSMNKCNPRGSNTVKKLTIHHVAAQGTTAGVLSWFTNPASGGSANYVIDANGIIGCNVPENYRAWTSSSAENDYQAITIELCNDGGAPYWHVADKTIQRCVELCIDVCKRYNIKQINFTGDKSGNLTMHKWFAPTGCPGPYMETQFPNIADAINRALNNVSGDVNNDGKLNAKDVTLLMKSLVNGTTKLLTNADFNKDGKINAKDVTAMMKAMVGSKPNTGAKFNIGDKVKVRVGVRTYYDGTTMPNWVRVADLYVRELQNNGTKVVVSTQATGAITGVVKSEDLVKV